MFINSRRHIRVLSIFVCLFCLQLSLIAQDYDDYLLKAKQRLAEGDCTRAEQDYNIYKELTHKSDVNIEKKIMDCISKKESILLDLDGEFDALEDMPPDITIYVNGVSFVMKAIEGGSFMMGCVGCDPDEPDKDERNVHSVILDGYYLGETEVTQALWTAVMGKNPSHFKGEQLPVESISWNDCQDFIARLNQLTGRNFRLPTEAEWEYASRGGQMSFGYFFSGSDNANAVAIFDVNSFNKGRQDPDYGSHRVKSKKSNEIGLYDMSGNVWEWCNDWYDDYPTSSQTNPTGPSKGMFKVIRGGSWMYDKWYSRVSNRYKYLPIVKKSDCGFRLALSR